MYQPAAKRRARLAGAHLAAFDQALGWAGTGRETVEATVSGRFGADPRIAGTADGKLDPGIARQ